MSDRTPVREQGPEQALCHLLNLSPDDPAHAREAAARPPRHDNAYDVGVVQPYRGDGEGNDGVMRNGRGEATWCP